MHVLSTDSHPVENNFDIYFDSSIKNIQIFTNFAAPFDIKIYNISGAQVLDKKQVKAKEFVNVSRLKRGIYILRAKNDGKQFSKKLILY